jgi:hypothetical protein
MASFKSYNSFEEMMADIQKNLEEADSGVQPWQTEMKDGEYFLRVDGEIPIYGKIVSPFQIYDDYRANGEMDEELEEEEKWEREARAQPHLKNMRFSMCYSMYCPEGELGDTHIVSMYRKLTEEQFNYAKESNWNPDFKKLFEMAK